MSPERMVTFRSVPGDSARLRGCAIPWLQTRPLETRSSFSDRVRRELSNGGSVGQFWSRNEKIDIYAMIGNVCILLLFSGVKVGRGKSGRLTGKLGSAGKPRVPAWVL